VFGFCRTGRTLQGMNVGPVEQHRSPNRFRFFCDIGKKKFEGSNPGVTYSIFSRCTTIVMPEDKLSSSLYFVGKFPMK